MARSFLEWLKDAVCRGCHRYPYSYKQNPTEDQIMLALDHGLSRSQLPN